MNPRPLTKVPPLRHSVSGELRSVLLTIRLLGRARLALALSPFYLFLASHPYAHLYTNRIARGRAPSHLVSIMLDQFLQYLSQLFLAQDAEQFAQAIPLDPTHQNWSTLKNVLQSVRFLLAYQSLLTSDTHQPNQHGHIRLVHPIYPDRISQSIRAIRSGSLQTYQGRGRGSQGVGGKAPRRQAAKISELTGRRKTQETGAHAYFSRLRRACECVAIPPEAD